MSGVPEDTSALAEQALRGLQRIALMSKNYSSYKNLSDATDSLRKQAKLAKAASLRPDVGWTSPDRQMSPSKTGSLPSVTSPARAKGTPDRSGSSSGKSPALDRFPSLSKTAESDASRSRASLGKFESKQPPSQLLEFVKQNEKTTKLSDKEIMDKMNASLAASVRVPVTPSPIVQPRSPVSAARRATEARVPLPTAAAAAGDCSSSEDDAEFNAELALAESSSPVARWRGELAVFTNSGLLPFAVSLSLCWHGDCRSTNL